LEIPFLTTKELCTPILFSQRCAVSIVETASNIQIRKLAFSDLCSTALDSKQALIMGSQKQIIASSIKQSFPLQASSNRQHLLVRGVVEFYSSISTLRPPFVIHDTSPPQLSVSVVSFFEVAVVCGFMSQCGSRAVNLCRADQFWAFCIIMARNPPIRANHIHVDEHHPFVELSSEQTPESKVSTGLQPDSSSSLCATLLPQPPFVLVHHKQNE
jgi:hypothetical protein